jgi:hypothetical protein
VLVAAVQIIKILGVLVLVAGVMSISAAGALGLITFQFPQAVTGLWSVASEILIWARLLLVAVVAGGMLTKRSGEAE